MPEKVAHIKAFENANLSSNSRGKASQEEPSLRVARELWGTCQAAYQHVAQDWHSCAEDVLTEAGATVMIAAVSASTTVILRNIVILLVSKPEWLP